MEFYSFSRNLLCIGMENWSLQSLWSCVACLHLFPYYVEKELKGLHAAVFFQYLKYFVIRAADEQHWRNYKYCRLKESLHIAWVSGETGWSLTWVPGTMTLKMPQSSESIRTGGHEEGLHCRVSENLKFKKQKTRNQTSKLINSVNCMHLLVPTVSFWTLWTDDQNVITINVF